MATTIRRWVKWRKRLDYKERKEKGKNEFDSMKEKLIWQRWWKTENKTIVKGRKGKKSDLLPEGKSKAGWRRKEKEVKAFQAKEGKINILLQKVMVIKRNINETQNE